ncbi:stress-induced receptor-like kinase [Medicago truncatula]|uniref:Stress-induced receptor-like kinase n=2 Tax=Medicago truncatula TaxID=3880 RepID=A0A072VFU3_MEDTR|nr:stress-induced receptor-like kinase [Medicago truncatula]
MVGVLLLHHHQTCDAITNTSNQTFCPPSSCGKITNITHPFRLKDDPTSCGDPRYELSCENNITMLTLLSGKYYVKSINYNNYTIRLVDPGIEEGDCSTIPHYYLYNYNFSSSYIYDSVDPYQTYQRRIVDTTIYENAEALTLEILKYPTTLQMFQHVIYMNCSSPVRDDPVYADAAACMNKSNSQGGHVYAIAGDLKVRDYKDDDCHVEVVTPISFFRYNYSSKEWNTPDGKFSYMDKSYPSYYKNKWKVPNQMFDYSEIHRMLVSGFEVSWMTGACEDHCGVRDCYLRETTWSLECNDPSSPCITTLGFHVGCPPYLFGDLGPPSKLRMFVEGIMYGIARGLTHAIGVKIYDGAQGVSESKIGIDIGKIIGRYILSSYILIRFMLGLIALFGKLIHTYRSRHTSMYENIEDFLQGNSLMPIRYSYKEIKQMTRSFKEKLGEGGYGKVYKGKLRSGPLVAIKMLGKLKGNGNGQDFISEVATIGKIHHTNVVRLVGFCVEKSKRALVYDFMPNGSLDRYISSREDHISLTYKQMYEISLGVARGIAYLHQGCDMQILHFDIKPHNILLDQDFIAKVSDFGLAKLYPVDNSIVTLTAARGTIGYMAPELFYKNIGKVSYKADVYSFGMLLMEIANRRRNLNSNADDSSQIFFPYWIYNELMEEREIDISGEATDEEKKNVKKMFIIALWCIQLNPIDRPSMDRVIEMLEGDIEDIEIPPKPSPYPTEIIQDNGVSSTESLWDDDVTGSISFIEETVEDPLL